MGLCGRKAESDSLPKYNDTENKPVTGSEIVSLLGQQDKYQKPGIIIIGLLTPIKAQERKSSTIVLLFRV